MGANVLGGNNQAVCYIDEAGAAKCACIKTANIWATTANQATFLTAVAPVLLDDTASTYKAYSTGGSFNSFSVSIFLNLSL